MTDRQSNEYTTPPEAISDLIGQTLDGRYYVEQRLSSGGIGDLYLASDKPELLSRRVVVKVLKEKALEDEWIVTKFRQEVEALTRIDDPGVVGLLDAGTLPNGHPYLVMQFVEGDNLRSFMRPDHGMEFEDVADIWQQVGKTLTSAHECDVIHRDLKPENIMVRRKPDGSWQAKVIDFGIAKIRNSLVAPSTVTVKVAGTASYMSPEQLEGKRATAASDVYSLGVIAYEMVTGRRPFNPETFFQLSELQKGETLSPRALRPSLPIEAERVILRALSYNVSERYQRARDFGDSLSRALLNYSPLISAGSSSAASIETVPALPAAASAPALMPTIQSTPPASVTARSGAPTITSLISPDIPSSRDNSRDSVSKLWQRFAILALALLVFGFAGIFGWRVWRKSVAPERSLTFWLTVQRTYDGKSIGQPFETSGRDYFHTGDRFVFNTVTNEAGALYLIDEGRDEQGTTEWNILFPTKENKQGDSSVAARQDIRTDWYRFTGSTGIEQVWLVWSAQRNALLDSIFRDALTDGVIHDPGQQAKLREFLKRYESSTTELVQDEKTSRALLKGRGDILVRRLDFSHKPNS